MYVDGTDQINSVAADSGTLSVLAAAVAVVRERRGAAAAGEVLGTPLGQPVDLRSSSSSSSSGSSSSGSSSTTTCSSASSPGSVGLEGSILWQRMPLDDKPADAASLENDAFREALNRDPRMWRSFSRAELHQLGVPAEVPEQTFIREQTSIRVQTPPVHRCMQVLTTAPISPHRCPNRPSSGSRTPITNRAPRRRSRRARLDLRTREPFLGTSRYSSPGRRQRHLLASLPAPSSTGRRCRLGRRCGPARENFVIIDHSLVA